MAIYTRVEDEFVHIDKDSNYLIGAYVNKEKSKETVGEDAIIATCLDKNNVLLGVADGVGSSANSYIASEMIMKTLLKRVHDPAESNIRNVILDSIEHVNKELLKQANTPQTTLTLCLIQNNEIKTFQVGDSGMMLYGQRGKLKYKTLSHSPTGYAVEAGMLNEKEALTHPDNVFVCNIIGDSHMTVSMGPNLKMSRYDNILLASDGLLDNYLLDRLREVTCHGSFEQVFSKLVTSCREHINIVTQKPFIKADDISFIYCRRRK